MVEKAVDRALGIKEGDQVRSSCRWPIGRTGVGGEVAGTGRAAIKEQSASRLEQKTTTSATEISAQVTIPRDHTEV